METKNLVFTGDLSAKELMDYLEDILAFRASIYGLTQWDIDVIVTTIEKLKELSTYEGRQNVHAA